MGALAQQHRRVSSLAGLKADDTRGVKVRRWEAEVGDGVHDVAKAQSRGRHGQASQGDDVTRGVRSEAAVGGRGIAVED